MKFSDKLSIVVCDAEDDGEDRADFLCRGDIDLGPLANNQKISRIVQMTDPDGDPAGNLFVTLKWRDPYKERLKINPNFNKRSPGTIIFFRFLFFNLGKETIDAS